MGKAIAIKPENRDQLRARIDHAQGRCTVRTVSLFRIEQEAKSAEETLEAMGVPRSVRVGCRLEFVDTVPRSYRYTATATRAVLRRLSTGYWALEELSRERAHQEPGGGVRDNLFITEKAKASVMRAIMRKHGVRDMPAEVA